MTDINLQSKIARFFNFRILGEKTNPYVVFIEV